MGGAWSPPGLMEEAVPALLGSRAASATSTLPWEAQGKNLTGTLCVEHSLGTKHGPLLELTRSRVREGLRQKCFNGIGVLKVDVLNPVFKTRGRQDTGRTVVCIP